MKKLFGKRLKETRLRNKDRQEDLANELKVDTSMISKWENGINYPEVEKIIEIALYYKISIDYLVGMKENEEKTCIRTKYYKCNF